VVRRTRSAEFTPLSASLWAENFRTAGVPDGVFNLVNGIGEEAGDALVKHPDVPLISFTGETTTGQTIHRNCAANLKGMSMELGGKLPAVVFADEHRDEHRESRSEEDRLVTLGERGELARAGREGTRGGVGVEHREHGEADRSPDVEGRGDHGGCHAGVLVAHADEGEVLHRDEQHRQADAEQVEQARDGEQRAGDHQRAWAEPVEQLGGDREERQHEHGHRHVREPRLGDGAALDLDRRASRRRVGAAAPVR